MTSKAQLIETIEREHAALCALIESVPPKLRSAPDAWGDGWSVKDLVVHVTAWEQFFFSWYGGGKRGELVETPAPGYTWKETPRLNRDLQRKLARKSWKKALEEFDASYTKILRLAKRIDETELLEKGRYDWTGSSTVGNYLGTNTASHYRTAAKILKRWHRARGTMDAGRS